MVRKFFSVANVNELDILQLRNEPDRGVVDCICTAWELDFFKSGVILEAQLESWAEQASAVREVNALQMIQSFEYVPEIDIVEMVHTSKGKFLKVRRDQPHFA